MEKQNVFEIIKIILLVLIVLELGYIALQLKVPKVRPWPSQMLDEYGVLKEPLQVPSKHPTLGEMVNLNACYNYVSTEIKNIEMKNRQKKDDIESEGEQQ